MSCDNAEVRCSTLNLCAGARNAATCGFEFLHPIAFRLACPSCPACGAPGAQPKLVGAEIRHDRADRGRSVHPAALPNAHFSLAIAVMLLAGAVGAIR